MRKRVLLLAAAAVTLVVTARAQEPKKGPDERRELVVTGCIERSTLKVRGTGPFGSQTERFRLRANKDVLKVLTHDYNGHLVEVTGLLIDPANTQGRGKSVRVGKKTRVFTNAREVSDTPPMQDPSLEVRSFRNVNDTCR